MDVHIKKGYDLKLTGEAPLDTASWPVDKVGFNMEDFRYLKPKVLLKEGDKVKKGTPVICDKSNAEVLLVSPVSGVIAEIKRGERMVLLEVIIKRQGDEQESFPVLNSSSIRSLSDKDARQALLTRGLWPMLIRRPFHKIARVADAPACIYITAIDSNPNAADPAYYLAGRQADLQTGVDLLTRICPKIHLCIDGNRSGDSVFKKLQGVNIHSFSGRHPRGNLSVHIENIDPVLTHNKVVWSINAQNLAAMGRTLSTGNYDAERVFAYTGPAASDRKYYRTVQLASLSALPRQEGEVRMVSGSALSGRMLDQNNFLGYYDHMITVLPEGREKHFLGWLRPGFGAHSLTRCFVSNLVPQGGHAMSTTTNGDHRAIVDSEMYDKVQPLDIHTAYLSKMILADDIDEAKRLGLWSVAPEDFALASYMDPSKNDFAAALNKVLDHLHKEEK